MNDRQKIVDDIAKAVCDEIGGYEVSHPWMNGACDAVVARVLIVLDENRLLPYRDEA